MRISCIHRGGRIIITYGYHKGYPLNDGFHTGVDYYHSDRLIVSPMKSRVSYIGYDKTNGNYLVLESNGYRDWFAHIVKGGMKVSVGQQVEQGQVLAIMGTTGYSSGIHVHHSLRINGARVDPEKHIGKIIMIEDNSLWFTRMYRLMQQIRGRGLSRLEFKTNFVGQSPFRMVEVLSDHKEADKAQQAQVMGQKLISNGIKTLTKGIYEVK